MSDPAVAMLQSVRLPSLTFQLSAPCCLGWLVLVGCWHDAWQSQAGGTRANPIGEVSPGKDVTEPMLHRAGGLGATKTAFLEHKVAVDDVETATKKKECSCRPRCPLAALCMLLTRPRS